MNERLKELARQAGVYFGEAHVDYFGDEHPSYISTREMDVEKFAELIVEECRIVVAQVFRKNPMELCGPLAEVDDEIARHFGVEE